MNATKSITMNIKTLKELIFLYNAIQDGWTVSQTDGKYVLSSEDENKKNLDLEQVIRQYLSVSNFLIN